MRRILAALLAALPAIVAFRASAADFVRPALVFPAQPATPGQQCRAAIERAERVHGIPPRLLAAIGRVESGRASPDGRIDPWPFSINVEGVDHVFATEPEAVAAVRAFQAQGVRSIDTGCLQVNLMYHPDAFASLDDAFDPERNADYAARFLVALRGQTGSWEAATAAYHSATPELGGPYAQKVLAVWPEEAARPPPAAAVAMPAMPRPMAAAPIVTQAAVVPRILPMAAGAVGRGLAAYRAAPVALVSMRVPPGLRGP